MNDEDEAVVWTKIAGRGPTDRDYGGMLRHAQQTDTYDAQRWLRVVKEAMAIWQVPPEEAAELIVGITREINDRELMEHMRRDMPVWQQNLERSAWLVADAVNLGWISPVGIRKLRDALAEHDREAEERKRDYGEHT